MHGSCRICICVWQLPLHRSGRTPLLLARYRKKVVMGGYHTMSTTSVFSTPPHILPPMQPADCAFPLLQCVTPTFKTATANMIAAQETVHHTGNWKLTRRRWPASWSRHVLGQGKLHGPPPTLSRGLTTPHGMQQPATYSIPQNALEPCPLLSATDVFRESR